MNYKVLSNKVTTYASNIGGLLSFAKWNSRFEIGRGNTSNFLNKIKGSINLKPKQIGKIVLTALVAFLVVFAGIKVVRAVSGASKKDDRMEISKAKATQVINQEFHFPLRDDNGEEVNQLKYVVEKAEKRDEIIVQGQSATAVKGRTFLIITLKISNEFDQSIQINTRDYMRLSINGDESTWLAPDIHNDPVEVQAISTKSTRLGFPISDSDHDLKLRVGEIEGEKKTIDLTL